MTTQFDPNAAAAEDSGIFGLPMTEEGSSLVYLPVPWEVTTSYGGGTSQGPSAILKASHQVDLYDADVLRPYEPGLYILPESQDVQRWNEEAKGWAESGDSVEILNRINTQCEKMNQYVYQETRRLLTAGKLVGVVGGDHSVPFGALQAIGEKYPDFGILHFDAHSDTRKAYQGHTWSHASIMYNVLERIPQVSQLVQVGIRDVCEQEMNYIANQGRRVHCHLDRDLARRKMEGTSWGLLAREMIADLPNSVWVSFDIDGLDPRYCPHTGTPVPGGLDFHEANYLLSVLVRSGRKIVGFDLNEVAPNLDNSNDEWDANVGARLLYKLSAWTLASQNKSQLL